MNKKTDSSNNNVNKGGAMEKESTTSRLTGWKRPSRSTIKRWSVKPTSSCRSTIHKPTIAEGASFTKGKNSVMTQLLEEELRRHANKRLATKKACDKAHEIKTFNQKAKEDKTSSCEYCHASKNELKRRKRKKTTDKPDCR